MSDLTEQVREALACPHCHGTGEIPRCGRILETVCAKCGGGGLKRGTPDAVSRAIEVAASAAPSERQYERAKKAALRVLREEAPDA